MNLKWQTLRVGIVTVQSQWEGFEDPAIYTYTYIYTHTYLTVGK